MRADACRCDAVRNYRSLNMSPSSLACCVGDIDLLLENNWGHIMIWYGDMVPLGIPNPRDPCTLIVWLSHTPISRERGLVTMKGEQCHNPNLLFWPLFLRPLFLGVYFLAAIFKNLLFGGYF